MNTDLESTDWRWGSSFIFRFSLVLVRDLLLGREITRARDCEG